jgi:hypothetical protein
MDDRLLGAILWQFAKWWLRRRLRHAGRKAAIAGLFGLAALGVVAALRQPDRLPAGPR